MKKELVQKRMKRFAKQLHVSKPQPGDLMAKANKMMAKQDHKRVDNPPKYKAVPNMIKIVRGIKT